MKALLITLLTTTAAALFLREALCAPRRNSDARSDNRAATAARVRAPRTVQLSRRRILINGKPRQIFAGEVHYFRLKPEDWGDRLDKLKASGCDTVATYIPWIWHELADGTIDLCGTTHPQRNLTGFLDMCEERGLDVIARPGPFVMAELKNEGIPFRLYRNPTNLRPTSWHGKPVTTFTLDYLSPAFLNEVRGWYDAVMPLLAERLCTRGGNVIAVQLDNEIGMLSWASNQPDLTDRVCEDMRKWARTKYGDAVAGARIGANASDSAAWAAALREPKGNMLAMHQDLGLYNRDRYRRYVEALRHMAWGNGVRDVPFLINIHGTSSGRGRTFPIGISQLFESYRGVKGVMSGSDIYLGELTVANLPDLYALNAFMAAMHDADQPTSSLEFEAGDGNYGDDLGNLNSPAATELKTRLCIAQGNRLLNYYLHAGGENPPLECHDGLDRIAITGQRHGFAAPVGPEGQLNPAYFATKRVVESMNNIASLLADSDEEDDGFALGFVPDQYLTEYAYPGAKERAEQIADLERFRGMGPRDALVRNLLLGGFSFPAVDVQAGVPKVPCVVLSTGRTLGAKTQQNLASYVLGGGKLLLNGLLPDRDFDGSPCTILADALGVKDDGRVYDGPTPRGMYWTSVSAVGWAAPRPEVRVGFAQCLAPASGDAPLDAFMVESGSKLPCSVHVRAGKGEAIILGSDYASDLRLFKQMMARLGVKPRIELDANYPGVMVTSTIASAGQRLIHVINVAPYAVSLKLAYRGRKLFEGNAITVPERSGLILPLGVLAGRGTMIVESTCEIVAAGGDKLVVRPTQETDIIVLDATKPVALEDFRHGSVWQSGDKAVITLWRARHGVKPVQIRLG